jgi:hypothetical protein
MKHIISQLLVLAAIFLGLAPLHAGSKQRMTASRFSHIIAQARAQVQGNLKREMRQARSSNDPDAVAAVERKYRILNRELQRQIAELRQRVFSLREDITPSSAPSDADLVARLTVSYHPLALGAVKKVFTDFGDLYVNETRESNNIIGFRDLKVERPWSGYWYPFYDRSLYEGEAAPLKKFDALLQSLGYPDANVALSEQAKYAGFHPDSWEGFCDGWAIASIMTKEPTEALSISGLRFTIADQKALALFSHLAYPFTTYGLKYFGDAATDGTYQDIYPEGFHRLVTKVLADEKIPLIIDETAGVQVWNKPIFRYRWKIEQDPQKDYAFIVTAYPWLVRERWQVNDALTSMNDVIAPKYRYRLFVDKKLQRDGGYKVIAGEWIEESWDNHPGSVKYVKLGNQIKSSNEVFNKYVEVYKKYFIR